MSNDKIFRPNMPKLVVTDGTVATEEEKQPSDFTIVFAGGGEIIVHGFLVVTSAFIALMDQEDEITLVVPMSELRSVQRRAVVGAA